MFRRCGVAHHEAVAVKANGDLVIPIVVQGNAEQVWELAVTGVPRPQDRAEMVARQA